MKNGFTSRTVPGRHWPYNNKMPTASDALLRYRPWKGTFRPPIFAALAMARASLVLLLRRKLFWAVYALAGLVFFAYFFGQYLGVWLPQQIRGRTFALAGQGAKVELKLDDLIGGLIETVKLGGSADTFANFIWFEGHVAMIVLALAGAVLVGNDFHHGSLPFYLSKPIGRRHYVLGKVLGVGLFVNLLTTLPTVLLWLQAGMLQGWQTYYFEKFHLLLGILGYGAVLTVVLSLMLVAAAVLVRRTVPLVMVWGGLFVLLPRLAEFLADVQKAGPLWKLIDLWNNAYLVGLWLLRVEFTEQMRADEPAVWQAAAVLAGVCVACWVYLRQRVRGVEVVQ